MGMKFLKYFEGYVNKFDFVIGKIYRYDDLPKEIQNDIDVQFEDYSEESVYDFEWKFKLLKPSEIEEYVHNFFGEYDIQKIIETPHMQELINDIKNNGLDYPSVGNEGNHRALAHWYLKKTLPYLELIPFE